MSVRAGAPAGLLVVESGALRVECVPERSWTLGRDAANDIRIDHPSVSRHHATLRRDGSGWLLEDADSSNGTWSADEKVARLRIDGPTEVRLGRDGPLLRLAIADERRSDVPAPSPSSAGGSAADAADDISRLGDRGDLWRIGDGLRIGRAPDNDVVLPDPLVSRWHATIVPSDGGFELLDTGSSNGTFRNGVRVSAAPLADGDLLAVGSHLFRIEGPILQEYGQARGAWLCAEHLTVRIGGSRLLADVTFALEPSSLLGLVGPSGAGKTTLLRALNTQQPATEGRVVYGGRDLYRADDLRRRMGYVPQDDLLHTQLTVRAALGYAAELRFAGDVDRATREARIEEVLRELGLEQRRDLQIGRLSGGQRKRTSIAAELLARPPLLFLDEPTSGLDPGNEEQVTTLMRELADGGRTVVVATHSLVTLERCDRVLFLSRGGHVAYYGPPAEADAYFRDAGMGTSYPRVFAGLDAGDGAAIGEAFRRHPSHATNIEAPFARAGSVVSADETSSRRSWGAPFRQFRILVRRYLAVMRADRAAAIIMFVQAPFFALLFSMLYPEDVMRTDSAADATTLIWLLIVGAVWIGTSVAIREVVKERPILTRENGLGLSVGAYLSSKIAVLAALTVFQCAFLAFLAMLQHSVPPADPVLHQTFDEAGLYFPSRLPELAISVIGAGLASMALGLLASLLARTADQANVLLPLLLVAQVVLSAPLIRPPKGGLFDISGTFAAAQWGTAAAAASMNMNDVRRPFLELIETQREQAGNDPDPEFARGPESWDRTKGTWKGDLFALGILTVVPLLVAYVLLRLQLRVVRRR